MDMLAVASQGCVEAIHTIAMLNYMAMLTTCTCTCHMHMHMCMCM